MKNRPCPQAGLTLVELIIAVALLGFILLGIAPLFLASVKSNYSADQYTRIHTLSRDRLEQLMNLPAGHAQLANGPSLTPVPYPNDLPPFLPDPKTGVPPASGGVPNPLTRYYTVQHFVIPRETAVPVNTPFAPTPVAGAAPYHYKRIDVTVETVQPGPLGIGVRRARVSGIIPAPPGAPPPP